MDIRIGVPASFRAFSAVAVDLGLPILVSANAFWRDAEQRFWVPSADLFGGADVALDSAGFVAMFRYWHYRWALDAYVRFAGALRPTWWAAPDYCCEREIAADRREVLDRVVRTAFKLEWARRVAADLGVPPPLPVLQGWLPEDYERCAGMIPDLPSLVGVGSVCRRPLEGPAGLIAVVRHLDRVLPPGVWLHLFGAKGSAVAALAGHPRVASIDSQGWDFAARRERQRNGQASCTVAYRSTYLRRWAAEQVRGLAAGGLFANPTRIGLPAGRGTP